MGHKIRMTMVVLITVILVYNLSYGQDVQVRKGTQVITGDLTSVITNNSVNDAVTTIILTFGI